MESKGEGNYLAVSLRGPAQELLGEMSPDMRQNYFILLDALCARLWSEGQADLFRAQLKSRQRKSNETLPELAQSVRRLMSRAYPTAPRGIRETLSLEAFIEALNDGEIRLRLKQGKPTSLDEAVRMAIELEAFQQSENERLSGKSQKFARVAQLDHKQENQQLIEKIADLEKQLKALAGQLNEKSVSQSSSSDFRFNKQEGKKKVQNWKLEEIDCWNCGEMGHFRNQCPQKKKPRSKEFHSGEDKATESEKAQGNPQKLS